MSRTEILRQPIAFLSIPLICAVPGSGTAQNYPVKPVRIVASVAGTGSDFVMRLVAQGLSVNFGQQVVVDNRGIVGVETVARSTPDGYTLLLYGSPLWLSPLLRDNLPWDVFRDFAPITLTNSSPSIVVVHPSLPVKSVRDLIALAKSKPRQLNYGSGSSGSSTHLAAELFKHMAGINVVRIPYKGVGQALGFVMSGELQLIIPNSATGMPYVKAGRLRALAVASSAPSVLAPGLPTVTASGLPGYESITMQGLFAPARTPEALISRLNQELVKVLGSADVKASFLNAGGEAGGSSPEEFAAKIKSEIERMSKVVKAAGIREE